MDFTRVGRPTHTLHIAYAAPRSVLSEIRQWRIFILVIKETSVFTRRVQHLLDDDNYRLLQLALLQDPERGAVIPGTGGLRKIRWRVEGSGTRGGVRVIYYWYPGPEVILMLMIYAKTKQDDLTAQQKRVIRQLIERERL